MIIKNFFKLLLYALSFMAAFGITKLYFLLLSGKEFSSYVLILSIANFVRIVWYNASQSTFARFWTKVRDPDQHIVYNHLLNLTLLLPLAISSLAIVTILIMQEVFSVSVGLSFPMILSGLFLGIALGSSALIAEIDNVAQNSGRASFFMTMPSIAQLLCVYIGSQLGFGASEISLIAAALLAVSTAVNYYLLIDFNKPIANLSYPKLSSPLSSEMINFSLPIFIWSVPTLFLKSADRWIIASHTTTDVLAIFGVFILLSQNVIQAIYTILNRFSLPIIFREREAVDKKIAVERSHKGVLILTMTIFACGIALLVLLSVFGDVIIAKLSKAEYASFQGALVLICCAATLQGCSDSQILHGQLEAKLKHFIFPRFISAAVYMPLCVYLLPRYGIYGMGFATLGASIVSLFTTSVVSLGIYKDAARKT